jgi:hypothetical protein
VRGRADDAAGAVTVTTVVVPAALTVCVARGTVTVCAGLTTVAPGAVIVAAGSVIGAAGEAHFACLENGFSADDSRPQMTVGARHRRDNVERAGWFDRPLEERGRPER